MADVAPEQAVTEPRKHDRRQGIAAVLDRRVRDAAAGVEAPRAVEGACRAGVQAGTTRSAVIGLGLVRGQCNVGDELAEKELAAQVAIDETCVLPDPAQSGTLGEFLLEQGRGVHRRTPRRRRRPFGEEPSKPHEARTQRLVVVASSRVTGDGDVIAAAFERRLIAGFVVAHRHADDASGAGEEPAWVATNLRRVGHVPHVPVAAALHPAGEAVAAGKRVRRGDADQVELQDVPGMSLDLGSEQTVHAGSLAERYTAPVTGSFLVAAAIAAASCPPEVVFLDTQTGATVGRARLPGPGLAMFAAPDGRVVVPLSGEDATAVVSRSGKIERWNGRLFPLFFVEADRMYAVLPGVLATLSYPERLTIAQVPLPGVSGARRAGCSADGRLVAVVPAGVGDHTLLLAAGLDRTAPVRVALAAVASSVALAPDGSFVIAVSSAGGLELVVPASSRATRPFDPGGQARAAAVTPDGRLVLVGVAHRDFGEVVGIRVDIGAREPLREHTRLRLPAAVGAVAAAADEVVVAAGEWLVVLDAKGRHVRRRISAPGVVDLVLLPEKARSTVPRWSDASTP